MQAEKKVRTKGDIAFTLVCVAIVVACAVIVAVDKMPEKGSSYERLRYSNYIDLGEYKGLSAEQEKVRVTKSDVREEIQMRVSDAATTKAVKKGKIRNGDTVIIDYAGTINGESFPGGSAKDQELSIGSGAMIDGFEDGLIGKSVGEKVGLDLTFPEDYDNDEVAGKDAHFDVTIKSLSVPVKYKYNKEFLEKFTDFDNKKDYEAFVREELIKAAEEESAETVKANLFSQVADATTVKEYPKPLYKKEKQQYVDSQKNSAESYGMSWEDYLSATGMDQAAFNEQAKEAAKDAVKNGMIAYAIAKKENIKGSEEDAVKWLISELKENNYSQKEFEQAQGMSVEEFAKKNNLKKEVLLERVRDLIYEKAEITKVPPADTEQKDVSE